MSKNWHGNPLEEFCFGETKSNITIYQGGILNKKFEKNFLEENQRFSFVFLMSFVAYYLMRKL